MMKYQPLEIAPIVTNIDHLERRFFKIERHMGLCKQSAHFLFAQTQVKRGVTIKKLFGDDVDIVVLRFHV